MKSVDETTGASTVWVHSFHTRSVSRLRQPEQASVPALNAFVHLAETIGEPLCP